MKYTNNLKLPIYSNDDLFDMTEVNNAHKIIEHTHVNFLSDEDSRKINEGIRVSNEEERKQNETLRINKEVERNENEDNRRSSETTRVNKELKRNQDEENRLSNEETRKTNETTRNLNETSRRASETTREVNENTRKSDEAVRLSKEAERVNNEDTRKSKETERVNNENTRKTNETQRVNEENTRKTNETGRVSAESNRVENFNTMQIENEQFKTDTTNIVDNYKDVVDEHILNHPSNEEVERQVNDAKIDYNNKPHDTLKQAIDSNVFDLKEEIGEVWDEVNNASLLPYEGTSIHATETYQGYAKDSVIKGRTFQNLCPRVKPEQWDAGGDVDLPASEDFIKRYTSGKSTLYWFGKNRIHKLLKPNTKYTILVKFTLNGTEFNTINVLFGTNTGDRYSDSVAPVGTNKGSGIYKFVVTTVANFPVLTTQFTTCTLSFTTKAHVENSTWVQAENCLVLEGDHTNTPLNELPYFEGMKSVGEAEGVDGVYPIKVKSCGKNLWDINNVETVNDHKVLVEGSKITVEATKEGSYTSVIFKKNIEDLNGKTFRLSATSIQNTLSEVGSVVQMNVLLNDGTWQYVGISSGYLNNKVTLGNNVKSYTIRIYSNNSATVGLGATVVENLMLEEISPNQTTPSPYEPYQESISEIQLQAPLRCLPNGVKDECIQNQSEVVRRTNEINITGDLPFIKKKSMDGSVVYWEADISSIHPIISPGLGANNQLCNTMRIKNPYEDNNDCIWVLHNVNKFWVRIALNNTESTLEEVQEWLKANPTTIVYELDTPTYEEITTPTTLRTYDNTTYITTNNRLKPVISTKIPSNTPAKLRMSEEANKRLKQELIATEDKLVATDNTLKKMDTDLIKTTWEMDDRLYEIEWILEDSIGTTLNLINKSEIKSSGVRALSKFEQAKIIIESGDYDKEVLTSQLNKYVKRGVITQKEYDILISMIEDKEVVIQ